MICFKRIFPHNNHVTTNWTLSIKEPYRVRHVMSTMSRSQEFGVSEHMLVGPGRGRESTELGIKAAHTPGLSCQ